MGRYLTLRFKQRLLIAVVAAIVFSGFAAGGFAYWVVNATSGSAGASDAGFVQPPVSPTVPAISNSDTITVSWSAGQLANGGAVQGYYVTRNDGEAVCGSLATPHAGLSCQDTVSSDGTYSYTVNSVYDNWYAPATTGNVLVDTAAPTPAITAPLNYADSNEPTFSGAAGNQGVDSSHSADSHTVTVDICPGSTMGCATPTVLSADTHGTTSWSVTPSASLGPDGTYTAQASQSDGAGNTGHSGTDTFVIDTVAPTVTLTSPSGGYVNSNEPTFSGAAGNQGADASHSPDSHTVTVDVCPGSLIGCGSPTVLTADTHGTTGWSVTPSASLGPDGTYTAQAEQSDSAGDTGNSGAVTFTIDTTPPTTTDNAPAGWQNSTVTVTLSPTDPVVNGVHSGVAATYYTTDGTTPSVVGSVPQGTTQQGAAITLSNDGVYTIKYFSVDNAGNKEAVETAANKVMIDETAPNAGAVVTSGAYVSGGGTTFVETGQALTDATTSDSLSGVATVTYFYCSSSCAGTTPASAPGSWTSIGSASSGSYSVTWDNHLLTDGVYSLIAKAIDNAGNPAFSAIKTVTVDNAAPSTTIAINPPSPNGTNGWYKTTAPTFTLNASDAGSGVASTKYRIDSGTVQTYSGAVTIPDGQHTISYWSIDNVGNTESTHTTATIKVDTVAPSTNIAISPASPNGTNGWYKTTAPTFTLNASDAGSGVASTKYQIDSGTVQTYSGAVTIPDGQHTISYWSIDNAGNTESTHTTATIKVDTVKPTDAISLGASPSHAFLSGTTLYYKGNAAGSFSLVDTVSDATSGPASATFPALNSNGWTGAGGAVSTPAGGPFSSSYSFTAAQTLNPTSASVSSIDNAGNGSGGSTLTFVNDTTAPAGGALAPSGANLVSGTYYSNTGTYTIARTDYSEAMNGTQSGLASSILIRQTGTWNSGTSTCGSLAGTTMVTGNVSESGLAAACYVYTLTGTDNVGNAAATTVTVVVDKTAPTVTVAIASGQASSTSTQPINFTATFNEPVNALPANGTGITLGGTATHTGATIVVTPTSATVYNIAVSGLTSTGTVTATVNAAATTDYAGNVNTASSPSAAVTLTNTTVTRSTAGTYTLTVPAHVTSFTFTLNGAGGGGADASAAAGGIVSGSITIPDSATATNLTVVVGGGGKAGGAAGGGGIGCAAGGAGGTHQITGGGGGGATCIYVTSSSPIAVAGGGGGGGDNAGGAGSGGNTGTAGTSGTSGTAGGGGKTSPLTGGAGGASSNANPGTVGGTGGAAGGQGGSGGGGGNGGGGGGGGYASGGGGGGAKSGTSAGGGGGSGYSGGAGSITVSGVSTSGSGGAGGGAGADGTDGSVSFTGFGITISP